MENPKRILKKILGEETDLAMFEKTGEPFGLLGAVRELLLAFNRDASRGEAPDDGDQDRPGDHVRKKPRTELLVHTRPHF